MRRELGIFDKTHQFQRVMDFYVTRKFAKYVKWESLVILEDNLGLETKERIFGIWVDRTFKISNQFAESTKKKNQTLGIIRRNFKSKAIIKRLWEQMIRPHLEYCKSLLYGLSSSSL